MAPAFLPGSPGSSSAAMASASPGRTPGRRRGLLREVSRRRLFEDMLRQANAKCSAAAAASSPRSGGESQPLYFVLIVDTATLRLLETICQLHDLFEENVCLVEAINAPRDPMPSLHALYFIVPSSANVELLLQDASGRDPKYASFHALFTHRLQEELLRAVAQSQEVVPRIQTFAELNLSFLTHDSRCFHLSDAQAALASIMDGVAPERAVVQETACKLATVFASMALRPHILYDTRSASGAGTGGNICTQLAHELSKRLSEMEPRISRTSPLPRCTLLIVDRSIDWVSTLLHDMHYEAILFDLLGDAGANIEDATCKYVESSGSEEKVAVLSESKDHLWEKWRHMPFWQVRDLVVEELRIFQRRDEELRARDGGAAPSAGVTQDVSRAVNRLHMLPELKEQSQLLQVHSDICVRCAEAISSRHLNDVAALEQDIATGIKRTGEGLKSSALDRAVVNSLQDPHLDASTKLRLLLLLLASGEGATFSEARRAELASLAAQNGLALSQVWAAVQRRESKELHSRWKHRFRERVRGQGNAGSESNALLLRWEPRLRGLFEDIANGKMNSIDFPLLGDTRGTGAPRPEPGSVIIVYVIGGVTVAEAQVAYEVSEKLGVEAYVGGSCMLTPPAVVAALESAARSTHSMRQPFWRRP